MIEGQTELEQVMFAIENVLEHKKYPRKSFSSTVLSTTFRHRMPMTGAHYLARRSKRSPEDCESILSRADSHDREILQIAPFDESHPNYDLDSFDNFGSSTDRRQKENSLFSPCTFSGPGTPAPAVLENIVEAVANGTGPVADFLGVIISGLCSHQRLMKAKVSELSGVTFLVTPSAPPQTRPQGSLHMSVEDNLHRPLARRLACAFSTLTKSGTIERTCGEVQSWLDTKFSISLRQLEFSLRTLGPQVLDYPWIVSQLGLASETRNPDGPEAYTLVDWKIIKRLQPLLQRFEPANILPTYLELPASGSALCPIKSELQNMFQKWLSLLHQVECAVSTSELIDRINGVVAGAHALIILCSGLRNYPLPAPTMDMLGGRVEIVKNKGIRAWYVPSNLRPYLERVRKVWRCAAENLPQLSLFRQSIYSFIDPDTHTLIHPSARNLKMGLLSNPELSRFADFHDNFLRHFSNSTLRAQGFCEFSVRSFHGHRSGARNPFRSTSLNSAIDIHLHESVSNELLREIGL